MSWGNLYANCVSGSVLEIDTQCVCTRSNSLKGFADAVKGVIFSAFLSYEHFVLCYVFGKMP